MAARRTRLKFVSRIAMLVTSLGIWSLASSAEACGGTFCDNGPRAMPVDQTGENIVFVPEADGTISAHVQVQYTAGAERLAWLVPLPGVPEISVGSEPFFDRLLTATVPTFGFTRGGCGRVLRVEGGGGIDESEAQGVEPNVVVQGTVGAFDVVVLQGGSPEEIVAWLADNDYQQPPETADFLRPYADEGMSFAAFKLSATASSDQIHPIVFRYAAESAAIPLRLTGIAASDDMAIRVFFLGAGRYVPTNYMHVALNLARLDWPNFASNYYDVLSAALDEAGGLAFVTEYAGPTPQGAALYNPMWAADELVQAAPAEVVGVLERFGLLSCSGATCQANHPLILPLLRTYLPAPAGVDEQAFYSCGSCYPEYFETVAYDGAAMGRDFLERIVVPAREADRVLGENPIATRLMTLLDANEMVEDPAFHERSDLSNVSNSQSSVWELACSAGANSAYTLPWDLPQVALTQEATWPNFDESMPFALLAEKIPKSGDAETVLDNTDAVRDRLEAWNAERDWPPAPAEEPQAEPLVLPPDDPSLAEEPAAAEPSKTMTTEMGASDEQAEPAAKGDDRGDAGPSSTTSDSDDEGPVRRAAGGGCSSGAVTPRGVGDAFAFGSLLLGFGAARRRRGRSNRNARRVEPS